MSIADPWASVVSRARSEPAAVAELRAGLQAAAEALTAAGLPQDLPDVDAWLLAGGPDECRLALTERGQPLVWQHQAWAECGAARQLVKALERAADRYVHDTE